MRNTVARAVAVRPGSDDEHAEDVGHEAGDAAETLRGTSACAAEVVAVLQDDEVASPRRTSRFGVGERNCRASQRTAFQPLSLNGIISNKASIKDV